MILSAVVDFETSKLLRDKEFENTAPHKLHRSYYNHLGEYRGDVSEYIKARVGGLDTKPFESVDAPTIGQVVDWLFEKHGIWLDIIIFYDKDLEGFYWNDGIINTKNFQRNSTNLNYSSPLAAYESTIVYCLSFLI